MVRDFICFVMDFWLFIFGLGMNFVQVYELELIYFDGCFVGEGFFEFLFEIG